MRPHKFSSTESHHDLFGKTDNLSLRHPEIRNCSSWNILNPTTDDREPTTDDQRPTTVFLIQPNQKDPTLTRLRFPHHFFRPRSQIILHPPPPPPIPSRTIKRQHLRGVIAPRQMPSQIPRIFFPLEPPNLYCPLSSAFDRLRSLQHLNPHRGCPLLHQP